MTGPALEVVGLAKGYEKNGRLVPVLDLERLAVQDGEFVTIVSPSGCGTHDIDEAVYLGDRVLVLSARPALGVRCEEFSKEPLEPRS